MHMMKLKLSAAKGMFTYDGRQPGDYVNPETHGETLHPERTVDNYAITYERRKDGSNGLCKRSPHYARERCAEALDGARERHVGTTGKSPRTDAVGAVQWCITLPQGVPPERALEFFGRMFTFMRRRYGAENVPAGFVHMDETTPHMHVPVIAMRDGRFQAKNIFDRRDLSTIHGAAESTMSEHGLGGLLLSDDQQLEKAFSKLSRSEMNAVKAYIKASSDAQTASKRLELKKWEEGLQQREAYAREHLGAFEGRVLNAEALSELQVSGERSRVKSDRLQSRIDEAARAADSFDIDVSDALEQGEY